jgi:very-short-patch-repair endonuclease
VKTANIIIGQKINPTKQERPKQLRWEMTSEEKKLWFYLRNNQLNGLQFRKQQVINGFIADFYCHSAGAVVEVDGKIHEQQKEYDARRDQIFSARGLRVIRIRNEEIINDIYHVLKLIQQVCECELKK